MKTILILQNKILHYRKALYNELSKTYNIVVLHSGKESVTTNDNYKEIIVKHKKVGSFIFQYGVLNNIRSSNYDVIISMFDIHWINNIISYFLASKSKKFIWWGQWLTNNNIADKLKVYFSNQKCKSILYTESIKIDFVKKGVNPDNLFVANNTFDVGKRYKSYKNDRKDCILFVGSFDKRKQLDKLIITFSNILKSIPEYINLILIGDGQEWLRIKELIEELNIKDRVILEGKITENSKLVEFYKRSLISVSYGQAGLSVLQAFGYGVPFLTKENAISGGEKTNIKDNYNGYLCADNLEVLKRNLIFICNNESEARNMGENAFNYYSNNCTIENMAKGFINAIETN